MSIRLLHAPSCVPDIAVAQPRAPVRSANFLSLFRPPAPGSYAASADCGHTKEEACGYRLRIESHGLADSDERSNPRWLCGPYPTPGLSSSRDFDDDTPGGAAVRLPDRGPGPARARLDHRGPARSPWRFKSLTFWLQCRCKQRLLAHSVAVGLPSRARAGLGMWPGPSGSSAPTAAGRGSPGRRAGPLLPCATVTGGRLHGTRFNWPRRAADRPADRPVQGPVCRCGRAPASPPGCRYQPASLPLPACHWQPASEWRQW